MDFLESNELPADRVEVVLRQADHPHSFTLVGDWFLAEAFAVKLGTGYRQTMFTRHGPTVHARLQEFEELLEESGIEPSASREAALRLLHQRMDELPTPGD